MQPQSFSIVQGETLAMPVTVTDTDGEPLDLTGATALFGITRVAGDQLVAGTEATPATATAVVRDPQGSGVIDVTVEGSVIATLLGTYEWECRARDVLGGEVVVARGYLTVSQRVLGVTPSP